MFFRFKGLLVAAIAVASAGAQTEIRLRGGVDIPKEEFESKFLAVAKRCTAEAGQKLIATISGRTPSIEGCLTGDETVHCELGRDRAYFRVRPVDNETSFMEAYYYRTGTEPFKVVAYSHHLDARPVPALRYQMIERFEYDALGRKINRRMVAANARIVVPSFPSGGVRVTNVATKHPTQFTFDANEYLACLKALVK